MTRIITCSKPKLGFAGIAWSDDGVTRFRLPDPRSRRRPKQQFTARREPADAAAAIAAVVEQAKRYFAGERIDFSPIGP